LFNAGHKHSETALATRHYLEEVARNGQMDFFSEPEKEFVREPIDLRSQRRFDFDNAFGDRILTEGMAEEKVFPRWGIND